MHGKRRSIRFKGYDYSENGLYFVTIDLESKKSLFWEKINIIGQGKINIIGQGKINIIGRTHRSARTENQLNKIGLMIDYWWNEIPNHFNNIIIDEYVVMPNHVHGILIINNNSVGADRCVRPFNNQNNIVNNQNNIVNNQMNPKLGNIIQWFKTMTTNQYIKNVKNQNWPRFFKRLWQRNYYERIIRNKKEYLAIKNYIRNNPEKLLNTKNPPSINSGGF